MLKVCLGLFVLVPLCMDSSGICDKKLSSSESNSSEGGSKGGSEGGSELPLWATKHDIFKS